MRRHACAMLRPPLISLRNFARVLLSRSFGFWPRRFRGFRFIGSLCSAGHARRSGHGSLAAGADVLLHILKRNFSGLSDRAASALRDLVDDGQRDAAVDRCPTLTHAALEKFEHIGDSMLCNGRSHAIGVFPVRVFGATDRLISTTYAPLVIVTCSTVATSKLIECERSIR